MIIDFKKILLKRKRINRIHNSIETQAYKLSTHAVWLCADQYTAELAIDETINQLSQSITSTNNIQQLQNSIYLELKKQCSQICSTNSVEIHKTNSQFTKTELFYALKGIPDTLNEPLAMQVISRLSNTDIMQFLGISNQELMLRLRSARENLLAITQHPEIAKSTASKSLSA